MFETISKWALCATTLGWLTWAGFTATLLGLYLAFREIKRTAKAAKMAATSAEAASTAVQGLRVALDGANAAHASGQMNTVLVALQNSQFDVAEALFMPVRRTIQLKLLTMPEAERGALQRRLDTVHLHIGYAQTGSTSYRRQSLVKALNGLHDSAISWEQEALNKGGQTR